MSTISASTTSTTAYKVTGDTTGTLVFQTGASPTTALTLGSDQKATFAYPPTATGGGSIATNTAYGTSALAGVNTGIGENVGIGYEALKVNTSGSRNTAVGLYAAGANTTGIKNVAVGNSAMDSNTSGSYNIAIGPEALHLNTTASYNTALGYQAAYNANSGNQTAVGYQAGYSNSAGGVNTFVGYQAGYYFTGGGNVIVGSRTVGSAGTPCSGNYNAIFGDSAGSALQGTSASNTFIGGSAGYYITTGTKNTILGAYNGNQGGLDIRTASNYIVLSDGDGNPRGIFETANFLIGSTTNALTGGIMIIPNNGNSLIRVGHVAGTGSTSYYSQFYYDSNLIGSIQQSGTTAVTYLTSSDYRLKEDIQPMQNALAKVAALKPCTYKWKSDGSFGEGFIAHELAEVAPLCVSGEKDEVDEDGNPKYQGIDTSFLVATLAAAIQELKADLDATKAELAALKGAQQ